MPSALQPASHRSIIWSDAWKEIFSYSSIWSARRAARLSARACTVISSGRSFSTISMVCETSSIPSPGSPTIRSMLILSKPRERAVSNARTVSSTVCLRPIRSRVFWFMVCGLTLIRVTGCARSTSSFSFVMLSGRPASTVNSIACDRSKSSSTAHRRRSICRGVRVVGVPPPT